MSAYVHRRCALRPAEPQCKSTGSDPASGLKGTGNEVRRDHLDPEILEYYKRGSANLDALGYTDHSVAHTRLVAGKAAEILDAFGYSAQEAELARIAGFMHDIGNAINRNHHAEYGALLANEILKNTDLSIPARVRHCQP